MTTTSVIWALCNQIMGLWGHVTIMVVAGDGCGRDLEART